MGMKTPVQALRDLLGTLRCTKCGRPAVTGDLSDLRCYDHIGCGVMDRPNFSEALRAAQDAMEAFDKAHEATALPPVCPTPGEVWQHFKGNTYRTLTVAVLENTGAPLVVYTGPDGTHARSLVEFLGSLSRDGYDGPRFVKVEDSLTMPDAGAMLRALIEVVSLDTTVVMGTPMDPDEAFNAIIESGKAARRALGIALDGSEDCDEDGDGPPPKLRALLETNPPDELTRSRSYEAATRDTITWNVDGPASAELLNVKVDLDFTKDQLKALARVFRGLTGISRRPEDPYITLVAGGWRVRLGDALGIVSGELSVALDRADFPKEAEVIKMIEEAR